MHFCDSDGDSDSEDDRLIELDKEETKARSMYQPPVFWLPGGRVVFDNHSLSGKHLHAHCRKHNIPLPIPEGERGFVAVSQQVAYDAKIIAAMQTIGY